MDGLKRYNSVEVISYDGSCCNEDGAVIGTEDIACMEKCNKSWKAVPTVIIDSSSSIGRKSSIQSERIASIIIDQPNTVIKYAKEMIVKILQVLVAVACIALYKDDSKYLVTNVTSMMFPNVVFATFVLITSVIMLSFWINNPMPDILIRIFNILATMLYFISGCITTQWWNTNGRYGVTNSICDELPEEPQQFGQSLLAASVLSFVNVLLYAVDVGFSFHNIHKQFSYEKK